MQTFADWQNAFSKTFTTENVVTGDQGTSSYSACFEKLADRCEQFTFAERDEFGRVTSFEPGDSRTVVVFHFVPVSVIIADCGLPQIQLAPRYDGDSGWLFLDQVAVLADGKLALQHTAAAGTVKRDQNSGSGVREVFNFTASGAEIDALRTIAGSKKVIVRLSGDKGYVALSEANAVRFQNSVKTALLVHDRLMASLKDHLPKTCAAPA